METMRYILVYFSVQYNLSEYEIYTALCLQIHIIKIMKSTLSPSCPSSLVMWHAKVVGIWGTVIHLSIQPLYWVITKSKSQEVSEKAEKSYFGTFDCLSQGDTSSQEGKVYVPVFLEVRENLHVHFLKLL